MNPILIVLGVIGIVASALFWLSMCCESDAQDRHLGYK